VVNAFGDVLDEKGKVMAGVRESKAGVRLLSTKELLKKGVKKERFGFAPLQNTTLAVIATNARLEKGELVKLAQLSCNGLAKSISPFGTTFDGDVIFALSTGEGSLEINNLGALAEEALAEATRRAIIKADGLGVLPAYRDLR